LKQEQQKRTAAAASRARADKERSLVLYATKRSEEFISMTSSTALSAAELLNPINPKFKIYWDRKHYSSLNEQKEATWGTSWL
jgi:hypothetical protein